MFSHLVNAGVNAVMPLWGRRPMKIDVRLPEEGLWQNSFEFAGKGIQRYMISHELIIPDCRLTRLIMGKAKSGARNSTAKRQREKGKENDRSSSVETHSVEEKKRVMINCTNNCTKQSATVHLMYILSLSKTVWLSGIRVPILLLTLHSSRTVDFWTFLLGPGFFFSFYQGRTFSFWLFSLFHAFHGRVRKISPRIWL